MHIVFCAIKEYKKPAQNMCYKYFIALAFLLTLGFCSGSTGHFIVQVDLSEYSNLYDRGSNGNRCEGSYWFAATSDCDPHFKVRFLIGGFPSVEKVSKVWRDTRIIHGTFFTAQYSINIKMPPNERQMSVTVEAFDHDEHSGHDHMADQTFYFKIGSRLDRTQKLANQHLSMQVRIQVKCDQGYFGQRCTENIWRTKIQTTSTTTSTTTIPTTTTTTKTPTTITSTSIPTTATSTRKPSTVTSASILTTFYHEIVIATSTISKISNSSVLKLQADSNSSNGIPVETSRILLIACSMLFVLVVTLIGIMTTILCRTRGRIAREKCNLNNGCATIIYRCDQQQWPVEESRAYGVSNATYTLDDKHTQDDQIDHVLQRKESENEIYETID